jgi:hypothetical protein
MRETHWENADGSLNWSTLAFVGLLLANGMGLVGIWPWVVMLVGWMVKDHSFTVKES